MGMSSICVTTGRMEASGLSAPEGRPSSLPPPSDPYSVLTGLLVGAASMLPPMVLTVIAGSLERVQGLRSPLFWE